MAAVILPGQQRPAPPPRPDGYIVVAQSAYLEERKQTAVTAVSVNSLQVSPNIMAGVMRLLGGATPKYAALYYVERLEKEGKDFPQLVDRGGSRVHVFPSSVVKGTPVDLDDIIRHHVYGKTLDGSPLPDYYDRYLPEPLEVVKDRGPETMEGITYIAGRRERARKDPEQPEESARDRFARLQRERQSTELRNAMKEAEKVRTQKNPNGKSPAKKSPQKSPRRSRSRSRSRSSSRSRSPSPAPRKSPPRAPNKSAPAPRKSPPRAPNKPSPAKQEDEDYEDEDSEYVGD